MSVWNWIFFHSRGARSALPSSEWATMMGFMLGFLMTRATPPMWERWMGDMRTVACSVFW